MSSYDQTESLSGGVSGTVVCTDSHSGGVCGLRVDLNV